MYALHFYGDEVGKGEVQVKVWKNKDAEVRLAVLNLDNGKAVTIYGGTVDDTIGTIAE